MSLTRTAIDRLIARVIDRVADRVISHPAAVFPIHPQDVAAALDRAATQVTKDRFKLMLDDGSFDHRVNDTIDYEVSDRLDRADITDEAKDRLDDIVEAKLDEAGFERRVERAVENLDLEEIAASKFDQIDFEDIAKEAVEDAMGGAIDLDDIAREQIVEKLGSVDPADMMRVHAKEFVQAALVARYEAPVGGTKDAMQRAAAEVISAAVATVVGEVSTTLEQAEEPKGGAA